DKLKISEIDITEVNNVLLHEFEEKNKIRDQLLEKKLAFLITKNDLLSELLEEIIKYDDNPNPEKKSEIIKKIKIHLKDDLNFVKNIYQKDFKKDIFTVSLLKKHPTLSSNDLKLLMLIYLETDTKEIAQLLFISPE